MFLYAVFMILFLWNMWQKKTLQMHWTTLRCIHVLEVELFFLNISENL